MSISTVTTSIAARKRPNNERVKVPGRQGVLSSLDTHVLTVTPSL